MKNDFKLIISLLQNTRFKVTIIIITLLSFMAFGYITKELTLINGIYDTFTWNFFIMVLLFLFIFNSYNILTELTKNYEFLIRMKNYKEFFSKMTKFIFVSNLIIYLIVIALVLIIAILRTGMNTRVDLIKYYNISNLVYLIFHLIRSYIILNMIVVVLMSMYKLIKEEIVVAISGLIPLSIVALTPLMREREITKIYNIHLYYGEYFIKNNYGSFTFEIFSSILFVILLIILSKILIEITSKKSIELEL